MYIRIHPVQVLKKNIKHRHAVMIISEFDDITGSVHPIQARDFGPNHIQLSHRPKRGRKEKQRRVLRRFALTKKNCKNRFLLTRSDLSKSTKISHVHLRRGPWTLKATRNTIQKDEGF